MIKPRINKVCMSSAFLIEVFWYIQAGPHLFNVCSHSLSPPGLPPASRARLCPPGAVAPWGQGQGLTGTGISRDMDRDRDSNRAHSSPKGRIPSASYKQERSFQKEKSPWNHWQLQVTKVSASQHCKNHHKIQYSYYLKPVSEQRFLGTNQWLYCSKCSS